jgi:DNA helicase HerA-like ATPase
MTTHPIPAAALDDRLGFIGMTGSGKTFGAGTCVERILANRSRVIIPDPLGVWWGLRQMADAKSPSPYEIVIFGGTHADLPITPHAGAIIGETLAGMRESAILDLSQFETAASERRFMLAFLEAPYRRSTGEPVHLIFDEADLWAPERIVDKEGEAAKLHGVMQTVVRRGRVKGLTSWLISQRPASMTNRSTGSSRPPMGDLPRCQEADQTNGGLRPSRRRLIQRCDPFHRTRRRRSGSALPAGGWRGRNTPVAGPAGRGGLQLLQGANILAPLWRTEIALP